MFKFKFTAKNISYIAMFVACEIVLNRFLSVNTAGIKLGFAFVPIALCAMSFGALPAALAAAMADFLGAMLFPIGPYHIGFTLCAAAMGFTYGVLLYNPQRYCAKKLYVYTFIAALINTLIFGLLLNTLWVSQLYGSKTYWGWFMYRIPEYAVGIPLRVAVIPALSRVSKYISNKNTSV